MVMTSYERYMAVCQLKEPDRVPVSPFIMTFAAKLAGVPYIDYCRAGEVMAEAQLACIRRFGYDAAALGSDAVREAETVGATIRWQKDEVPAATGEPLIKSRDDLRKLRLPDPLGKNRMHEQIKALKILRRELGDDEIVYAWVEAPFQESAMLRNINYFMMDLVGDPPLVHELMRFSLELELSFGLAQIEAGARFIGIGDSIASLVSPDHYQQFNFPYISELIAGLKAAGARVKYHACGNTKALLPFFSKLGADIINLDSLIDLKEAKLILGNNVCIKGNFSPTAILLRGTPETVRKAARRCILEGGLHGGFILSPGCEVPRDTPTENLEALIAVAKTDGIYPLNPDDLMNT
jgi:MtaA/CmuA family methyltransferase